MIEFYTPPQVASVSHDVHITIDKGRWTATKRFSFSSDPTIDSVMPLTTMVRYVYISMFSVNK